MENITAMPQSITDLDDQNSLVVDVSRRISLAVRTGNRQPVTRVDSSRKPELFLTKFGSLSGAYFTWDETTSSVGSVYYYRAIRAKTAARFQAAEALYKRFSSSHRGIVQRVFWDHLLPRFQVVFSDSEYTEDGKQVWKSLYERASSSSNYGIIVADVQRGIWGRLSSPQFQERSDSYWGSSSEFRKYRFGIYEKSHEDTILKSLRSGHV